MNRRMFNNRWSRVFLFVYSMSEVHLRNWEMGFLAAHSDQDHNSKHLKFWETISVWFIVSKLEAKHAASVHCQVIEAVALDSEREAGCDSQSRLHHEMRLSRGRPVTCDFLLCYSVEAILSLLCCKMSLWYSFSNKPLEEIKKDSSLDATQAFALCCSAHLLKYNQYLKRTGASDAALSILCPPQPPRSYN